MRFVDYFTYSSYSFWSLNSSLELEKKKLVVGSWRQSQRTYSNGFDELSFLGFELEVKK